MLANGGRGEWFLVEEPGRRELVAGYRGAGGVFEPRGLQVFSMAIATHHNFLAEMILATRRGDAWARDVLESMLAYPFTLEYLKRALDAVTYIRSGTSRRVLCRGAASARPVRDDRRGRRRRQQRRGASR